MKEKFMNMVIDHFKKSPVLHSAKTAVETALDHLNENFRFDPLQVSALAARLSPATDQLILEIERTERSKFIGGKLSIAMATDSGGEFRLLLKLYFKGDGEKIFLKEVAKQLPVTILTANSQAELRSKGEISFEVDPPAVG